MNVLALSLPLTTKDWDDLLEANLLPETLLRLGDKVETGIERRAASKPSVISFSESCFLFGLLLGDTFGDYSLLDKNCLVIYPDFV